MILMDGQRSCTAWASFNPSMLPGIWISENSSEMSQRDSRMESASSALTASTAVNPASSTMSTARMRRTISSSTTRTFGGHSVGPDDIECLTSAPLFFVAREPHNKARTVPKLDRFSVGEVGGLCDGFLFVGALDHLGWPSDVAIGGDGIDSICWHRCASGGGRTMDLWGMLWLCIIAHIRKQKRGAFPAVCRRPKPGGVWPPVKSAALPSLSVGR